MLGSTVALVSTFMARPLEEITVDELANLGPAFQAHLKSRGYKRNSVRSYMNYRRILLREAEKFGWVRQPSPLPVEWESVLELMPKDRSYRTIAVFAASRGKKPLDLTDTDLEDWLQAAVSQGRSFRYARELKGYFHSHVLRLGLRGYFPKLSLHPTDCYGIPLRNLPEPLRTQVGDLLNWLMAPLSFGRGSNSQLRPISAKHLEYLICRIAGFVFNVRKEIASRLEDLVNQERFASYLEWCVNHRGVRTGSLATQCRALYAALRKFRPLRGMDFSWMRELIADLPRDSYRLTKERKDRKWVHWSELVQVPKKIRDEADKRYRANPRRYAIAVRDQLIMAWLLTLPWRQRNLRECKLLPYEQGGNLFKSEISPMATFAKPRWVRSILQSNPHEQFWQFYFTEGQTKTGREVHSLLPRRLVPRLEEYISKYRPLLVRGDDPGNLFLNSAGKPLTIQSVAYIVENVTVRFAGRRVTPHVFRDIVAVRRLECHPADFPSVARLLWHSSPNTLFKFYGRNYDESYGVQRMEEWLDEQAPEVVGALFGKDAT
jgi:integrase